MLKCAALARRCGAVRGFRGTLVIVLRVIPKRYAVSGTPRFFLFSMRAPRHCAA